MGCFAEKPGIFERVSSIREIAYSAAHVACFEDFWPTQSMRSCLASAIPIPKANVSECKCRLSNTRQPCESSPMTEGASKLPIIPRSEPPTLEPRPMFRPGVFLDCESVSSLNAQPDPNYTKHIGQLHVSPTIASGLAIIPRPDPCKSPCTSLDPPDSEPRPVFKPNSSFTYGSLISLNALPGLSYTEHVGQLHVSPFVASMLPSSPKPTPPILEARLPVPKPSISDGGGSVSNLKPLPKVSDREHAGKLTLQGCLTWLARKLKPTRITMRCVKCVVIEAPAWSPSQP